MPKIIIIINEEDNYLRFNSQLVLMINPRILSILEVTHLWFAVETCLTLHQHYHLR